MNPSNLKELVRRAVADGEFKRLLLADPERALSGFALTGEEKAAVLRMRESFSLAGGETREANGGVGPMGFWW